MSATKKQLLIFSLFLTKTSLTKTKGVMTKKKSWGSFWNNKKSGQWHDKCTWKFKKTKHSRWFKYWSDRNTSTQYEWHLQWTSAAPTKQRNLVIFGLEEHNNDLEAAEALVCDVGVVAAISAVYRVGAVAENRPGTHLVKFETEQNRNGVYNNLSNLRGKQRWNQISVVSSCLHVSLHL